MLYSQLPEFAVRVSKRCDAVHGWGWNDLKSVSRLKSVPTVDCLRYPSRATREFLGWVREIGAHISFGGWLTAPIPWLLEMVLRDQFRVRADVSSRSASRYSN